MRRYLRMKVPAPVQHPAGAPGTTLVDGVDLRAEIELPPMWCTLGAVDAATS